MSNDSKTTYIGLLMGVATGLADYFGHVGPNGVDASQPTFWLGLVIAVAMAAKGFYTNKPNTPEAQ